MQEGTISLRVRSNALAGINLITNCLKVSDFIAATKNADFNSRQAVDMLQRQYTLNFRSRKAGLRAAALDNKYIYTFFLNLLIIIRRPLKPITQLLSRFFDNIIVSFKN
jgi:hypothetical protein